MKLDSRFAIRDSRFHGLGSDDYADITIRTLITGDKDPRLADALKFLTRLYKKPIGLNEVAIVFQQGETSLYLV